jgi:hypothetical protein
MAGGTLSIRLTIAEAAQFRDELQRIAAAGGGALDPLKASVGELSARFGTLADAQSLAAKAAAANKAAQDESRTAVANLRGQLDPAIALLARYQAQMDLVNTAVGRQAISQAEATTLLAAARTRYDEHVTVLGRASAATNNLGQGYGTAAYKAQQLSFQVNDVIASLGSGIPVTTMIMQQGGQVTQIYGGVAGTFRALVSAVTPVGLALAALAAGLAYVAVSAESTERKTLSLQNALRGTRNDYVAMAVDVESASKAAAAATLGLSTADAKAAATTIAKTGAFHGTAEELKGLVVLTASVSTAMGDDMGKAAELLAVALKDPAKAAQQLADEGLLSMSQALADNIKLMQAASDKAGASKLVIDALKTSYGEAHGALTPFQTALEHLKTTFTETDTKGDSFGSVLMEIATKAVSGVDSLFEKMKEIRAWTGTNIWGISPTGAAAPTGDAVTPSGTGRTSVIAGFLAGILDTIRRNTATGTSPIYDVPIGAGQTVYKNPESTAKGIFQLTDPTASRLGVNASDYSENITGGLMRIMEAATEWQQNIEATAKAFHLGTGGLSEKLAAAKGDITAVDQDYWSKVQAAKTSTLPTQVAADITTMATRANASSSQLDLALKIAVVESNGRQFVSKVAGAPAPAAVPNTGGAGASYGPFQDTEGAAKAREAIELATKYRDALGLIPDKAREVQAKITTMTLAMANLDPASDEYKKDAVALEHLKLELTNTIGPQDKLARSMQDALKAGVGVTPVMRDVAAIVQQFATTARDANEPLNTLARDTAVQAKLDSLAQGFNNATGTIELHTKAVKATSAMLDGDSVSLIDATNAQKAFEDATLSFLPNSAEFNEGMKERKRVLNDASAATADLKTKSDLYSQRDTLELIKAESAALGENQDERKKELDLLRKKQELVRAGADLSSEASQKTLAYVAAIDDATSALARQRSTMEELGSFMSSAFSTIQSAITTAFAQGTIKAINFGSVAKAMLSELVAEIAKLSVLNPLLNALEGKSLPTILGVVASLFGGSAASAASSVLDAGIGSPGSSASSAASKASGLSVDSASTDLGILSAVWKGANWLTDDLLSKTASSIWESVGGEGLKSSVTGWISSLFNPTTTGSSVGALEPLTGFMAGGESATSAVTSAAGEVADAAATVGEVASSTASIIAESLPFVGAAIGVAFKIAQGDYRGAAEIGGFTAAGAAIGSVVPVIGTAVGAAVGAIVGTIASMFGPGPEHAYSATAINAAGGKLTVGDTVSAVMNTQPRTDAAKAWVDQINALDAALNLTLTNTDGLIGSLGDNIEGYAQTLDPSTLFKNLRFTSASQTNNLGIAESQLLPGQSFENAQALVDFLVTIGKFTDNLDALGIKLGYVSAGFTNIGITGATGNSDVSRALNVDLPRQWYADKAALDAEVSKVYTFVAVTMPGLSAATGHAASSFVTNLAAINKTYNDAEVQAQSYNQSIDGLLTAQARLIEQQMVIAQNAIDVNQNSLSARYATATGDTQGAALIAFDSGVQAQLDSLRDLFLNYYGESGLTSAAYVSQQLQLTRTLAAERLAIEKTYADAALKVTAQTATDNLNLQIRAATVLGNSTQAALLTTNAKNATDRAALAAEGGNVALFDLVTAAEAAKTAFDDAKSAYTSALSQDITATQNQISALSSNTSALKSASEALKTYSSSLDSSSASPLTPEQRLAAATAAMAADAAKAGDTSLDASTRAAAAQQLQTDAANRLSIATQYFGQATQGYQTEYDAVKRAVDAVASQLEGESSVAQAQLDALNAQLVADQAQLDATNQIGAVTNANLQMLGATMKATEAALQAARDATAAGTKTPAPIVPAAPPPATSAAATAVTSAYQQLLGRAPDAAGLAYWVQQIDAGKITAAQVYAQIAGTSEAMTRQITQLYESVLGREPDAGGLASWLKAMSSGMSAEQVRSSLMASQEYKTKHGLELGGWVGNGVWNKDSVLAAFAGGGAIGLAGGEFVMSAPAAARYSDILPAMNSGRYASNDNAAVLGELRALRAELAALRQQHATGIQVSAQGHLATVKAVKEGTSVAQESAGIAKRLSAR